MLPQILNSYTPLGDYTQGKTDNALQVTAPWENLHVTSDNFKVWNKELFPAPPYVAEDAQDASPEMVAADARTIRLISSRIYQAASRIRHVFRKLDTDKNGVVDREEFNIGIAKLGLSIPRHQIDRFFTLIDEDNKGYIDYVKFLERFDAEAPEPKLKPPDRSSTEALVSRLDLSAEEVAEVASGEKAAALRERLFGLSNPASTVFRRLDLNGDGHLDLKEFARVCRTLVPGFTDREAACVLADMDPASDGFLTYKDFSTAMASYRPPHPREHHNSANPPCDTTFRGMQGGTRSRLGDSCMLHGPGDSPPVNHRTVAQIYARVNQARTEASAPALNTLWRSLSAAAAAGVAGYAPGKPGYRTLEQVADASLPLSSSSSRPSTAPDGAARSSPCMQSNTSGPGAFGRKSGSARTRGTWASRSILNPSPGAPGGPPTGMALDPEWEDARRERLRNHAAYNAYKDTSYMTKPQKGCPSSWEEERQYEPRPGVGAKVRSTTEDERAEKTVARQRMEARCSRSASAIAARQQKDADFHDGRDAARLAVLSEQKRKQAERIYLYNQCEVLQTDRMTNTLFTHRRTEVAKDKQGGHAGTVMSRYG